MAEWYRPLVALHVIAIISWMAGILYLYRLLVYATEQGVSDAKIHGLLSLMSRRLYRFITVPAMVVAWAVGLSLLHSNPSLLTMPWMHIKLGAVLFMTAFTIYAGALTIRYENKSGPLPSSKQLRALNEVPTLLMVVIVIMVIVRPFT